MEDSLNVLEDIEFYILKDSDDLYLDKHHKYIYDVLYNKFTQFFNYSGCHKFISRLYTKEDDIKDNNLKYFSYYEKKIIDRYIEKLNQFQVKNSTLLYNNILKIKEPIFNLDGYNDKDEVLLNKLLYEHSIFRISLRHDYDYSLIKLYNFTGFEWFYRCFFLNLKKFDDFKILKKLLNHFNTPFFPILVNDEPYYSDETLYVINLLKKKIRKILINKLCN